MLEYLKTHECQCIRKSLQKHTEPGTLLNQDRAFLDVRIGQNRHKKKYSNSLRPWNGRQQYRARPAQAAIFHEMTGLDRMKFQQTHLSLILAPRRHSTVEHKPNTTDPKTVITFCHPAPG